MGKKIRKRWNPRRREPELTGASSCPTQRGTLWEPRRRSKSYRNHSLWIHSRSGWLVGWLVGWFGWGWTIFGFELRVLHLLGRCYATWATPPALFSLVIFEIESHFLSTLAILLISASWISRIIGMSHWLLALWHKCPLKNERPLDHKKKSLQKESQQRQRKSSELLIKIRVEIN
jgi:hypothetical protein